MNAILHSPANALLASTAEAVKTYFSESLASWQGISQFCVIGALALCLLICLIVAIADPEGKKRKEEEKLNALRGEVIFLKNEILEITDECYDIDRSVAEAEERAQKEISALTEREIIICENEMAMDRRNRDKMSELAVKQQLLSDLLRRQQSGVLKSMKKSEVSDTQRILSNVTAEQQAHAKDIERRNDARARRAETLEKDIADVNRNLENYKLESKIKKETLTARRVELENRLNDLLYVNQSPETHEKQKTTTGEQLVRERDEQDARLKALEELRIAKAEYELACKRRQQAEKNKQIAVENAKAEAEERRKAYELAKKPKTIVKPTVEPQEQPPVDDDVQLIISDLNGDGTPTITEEPVAKVEETEVKQEQTPAEVKPTDDEREKQLSFDDEVVFTESEVEDIKYDDKARLGFTGVIENNSETDYSPVDAIIAKEATATSADEKKEESAATTVAQKQETTDEEKTESAYKDSFIEGFSSDEPKSIWKVVRQGDEFVAYLVVYGRKIAHTRGYPTLASVKKAIKTSIKCATKK
ncbi:MAG: hypothetical protein PUH90_05840, partial [Clostridia bacterium]|nr:hypothetical protein [Clostridia bacterium]